ncbi:amidohydrolase [Bacillus sp. JCM 19041]|uniref:amidohydrolase n=1 Tax=Bacillus sp. JCM 19041 TaxID=1460637 RepID=UPI0006CFC385
MRKAIVNGIVWTATGEKPKAQTVIIEGNRIKAVGSDLAIPDDATVVDARGCWVTPGFIDVHTHLGVHTQDIGGAGHDFNETVNPCTPEVRAIDAINPLDSGFADARKAGITTVQVLPGSANVIGGETCVIKTVGNTVDEMVVQAPSAMKAALGENPKQVYGAKGKSPATRMGVAAVLRQELMKAQDYAMKKRQGKVEVRDLGMEQLVPVVEGTLPMRVHVHRADDIITILRIAKEFSIQMTLEHVTEGHLVAKELTESGFRFTIGPTFSARSKQELAQKSWKTVQCFAEREVPFSITTDHPVIPIEHLITTASHALKYGISEEKMMEAVTIRAAEHLQLDSRLGTIEVGKDADIVIWTAAPLAAGTSVKQTFINGEAVYTKDGLFT